VLGGFKCDIEMMGELCELVTGFVSSGLPLFLLKFKADAEAHIIIQIICWSPFGSDTRGKQTDSH